MKVVIEIPDFEDEGLAVRYLEDMQRESDEAAAESPEDYPEGYGSLSLSTSHMSVGARVVGILQVDIPPYPPGLHTRYRIQPIKEGT